MYNYVTREQQNTFGYHLQPKFRKIGSKNCDLLDLFEEGIAKEKETIIQEEKHKIKTNYLASNYQKRIKKFIIDVSKNTNEILIFRWQKKTLI